MSYDGYWLITTQPQLPVQRVRLSCQVVASPPPFLFPLLVPPTPPFPFLRSVPHTPPFPSSPLPFPPHPCHSPCETKGSCIPHSLHGRTPVRQVEDDKGHGDADAAGHQRHDVGRPHHGLGDARVLVLLAALLRVRLHGHRVRRRQDPVLVGQRPCWVRLNL